MSVNSGTVISTNYGSTSRHIRLDWEKISSSDTNKTTTIRWTLKGEGPKDDHTVGWYMSSLFKVTIDETVVYSSSSSIKLYDGTVVSSGTYTLNHNTDGTKEFSIAIECSIYTGVVNVHGTGSFTLEPIIVGSSFLMLNDGTLGTSQVLKIYRPNTSYYHVVYYEDSYGTKYYIFEEPSSVTTTSFTPSLDLANGYPSYNRVSSRFTLITYDSSGEEVGRTEKFVSFDIPDNSSFKPIISNVAISDASGAYDLVGSYLKNVSKINFVVTPSGQHGALISYRNYTVDNNTYSKDNFTILATTKASIGYSLEVTDSRGLISSATTGTISFSDYNPPKINSLKVYRCRLDGTESISESNIKLVVNVSANSFIQSSEQKNPTVLDLYVKESGLPDSAYIRVQRFNNCYTGEYAHIVLDVLVDKAYDVKAEFRDDISGSFVAVAYNTVSTAFCLMNVNSDGKSMSFGGVEPTPYNPSGSGQAKYGFRFLTPVSFIGDTKLPTVIVNGVEKEIMVGDGGAEVFTITSTGSHVTGFDGKVIHNKMTNMYHAYAKFKYTYAYPLRPADADLVCTLPSQVTSNIPYLTGGNIVVTDADGTTIRDGGHAFLRPNGQMYFYMIGNDYPTKGMQYITFDWYGG